MSSWKPNYLIYHDYGGTPTNTDGVFNPYHALVFPDGSIRYRNPQDPYGSKAPHAYRLNGEAIGLSYAGPVGSKPTPEALETLRRENAKLQQMFPGIKGMGHGEAFQATKGTPRQASRDGRELMEAAWRASLNAEPVGGENAPGGPVPLQNRGLTTYAGLAEASPAQSPAAPAFMANSEYGRESGPNAQAPTMTADAAPMAPVMPGSGTDGGLKVPFGLSLSGIGRKQDGGEMLAAPLQPLQRQPLDLSMLYASMQPKKWGTV